MPAVYEQSVPNASYLSGPAIPNKATLMAEILKANSAEARLNLYARLNSTKTDGWADPTLTSKADTPAGAVPVASI